jgi:hypothetical protein
VVELEVTHVYEIRDGQIARVDEHDTVEEALEAAGCGSSALPICETLRGR